MILMYWRIVVLCCAHIYGEVYGVVIIVKYLFGQFRWILHKCLQFTSHVKQNSAYYMMTMFDSLLCLGPLFTSWWDNINLFQLWDNISIGTSTTCTIISCQYLSIIDLTYNLDNFANPTPLITQYMITIFEEYSYSHSDLYTSKTG